MESFADGRLATEHKLLEELPKLSDLHCAWTLLNQSAVLRANHTIRILPPSLSESYARKHDEAICQTFCKVFGAGSLVTDVLARNVATLPGRLGGLGLRSALRTAPAAYWASWLNALPVFASKMPNFCTWVLDELGTGS